MKSIKEVLGIIFLSLSVFLVSSCGASSDIVPSPTVLLSNTAKPTFAATIQPSETPTSTPPPTQTPDEILNDAVQHQCLDIDTDIVSIQNIIETGSVVFYDTASDATYILDLETNARYTLPLENQH